MAKAMFKMYPKRTIFGLTLMGTQASLFWLLFAKRVERLYEK